MNSGWGSVFEAVNVKLRSWIQPKDLFQSPIAVGALQKKTLLHWEKSTHHTHGWKPLAVPVSLLPNGTPTMGRRGEKSQKCTGTKDEQRVPAGWVSRWHHKSWWPGTWHRLDSGWEHFFVLVVVAGQNFLSAEAEHHLILKCIVHLVSSSSRTPSNFSSHRTSVRSECYWEISSCVCPHPNLPRGTSQNSLRDSGHQEIEAAKSDNIVTNSFPGRALPLSHTPAIQFSVVCGPVVLRVSSSSSSSVVFQEIESNWRSGQRRRRRRGELLLI